MTDKNLRTVTSTELSLFSSDRRPEDETVQNALVQIPETTPVRTPGLKKVGRVIRESF